MAAPKPKTLAEIQALAKQAEAETALYIVPLIAEADALISQAFTKERADAFADLINRTPDGDLKNQMTNVLSVLTHLGTFLGLERQRIAKFLPPPQS